MIKSINFNCIWDQPKLTVEEIMRLARRSSFKPRYKFLRTVMR